MVFLPIVLYHVVAIDEMIFQLIDAVFLQAQFSLEEIGVDATVAAGKQGKN